MSNDLTRDLKVEIALNVAAITSNTTTVGNIIDVRDAGRVNFSMFSGARTDGSYVILLEESDASDLSGSNAVADGDMLGQDPDSATAPEAQATITAANKIKKIGYVGTKAYVRPSIVSTSVTTGATLGCLVEKEPLVKPATITA